MNLTSLDNALRMLTPSEKKYKTNKDFYFFDSLPATEVNGMKVLKLEYISTAHLAAPKNNIFIKKQSRFQACPMHIHNWIEINYMYSGSCDQIINNTPYTLKKGQVVLIDTQTPHATNELGDDDIMINLILEKPFLNNNFFTRLSKDSIVSSFFINAINKNSNHDNYIVFHSENSRKLSIFFNELLCELYDPSINAADMINSLVNLILCELINVYEDDLEKENIIMHRNSISPILRFIEGNYKNCTLKSTADFFNMNPNYLTTMLKKHTGYSYKQLLQKQRLTVASRLLCSNVLSISEIIEHIGYQNETFFYKKFKEIYLCSPKEYREQKNKNQ